MLVNKNFIIFLSVLFFCKYLSAITPTPIVSYNSVTDSSGYMGPTSTLNSLAWDPSNKIMIGGIGGYRQMNFTGTSFGDLRRWQGSHNACVTCNSKGTYGAAAFSSGTWKGHIKIYDFDNNSQVLDYPGQLEQYLNLTDEVNLLAWSPDGTKLAAIYNNNTLKIYSISITPYSNGTYARGTLTPLGNVTVTGTVTTLSWNQSSTAIAVTASSIYVYNTSGSLLSTISGSFTAASWNPSASMNLYLAACSSSGTISIYKFTSISTAPTVPFTKDFAASSYGNPTKIAWSNDGTFVGVCSKTKPYVKTFKFSTSSGLSDFGSPVSLPGNGTDIGWNFDNKYLAVTADVYLNIYSFDSETSTPVINAPIASFTATPISGAAPLNVQFTGSGTNSPTSWAWDFGDGSSSASQSPSHTYTAGGTYTVKLTATNAGGSNSTTKIITVTVATPSPVASFTATPASGTAPLTVQFTGSGTNSPTSWAWDFGDGSSSASQSPSHTYTAGGTYTVKLTATNASGSNSTTKIITVTVESETTNTLQEALASIKNYDSTSLEAMLTIINNDSFNKESFQGVNGGNLIYAKLIGFYNNRTNINLELLAACSLGSSNGLLDLAVGKNLLNSSQKERISSMIEIIKLEFNLKIALIALNTGTDKLKAIDAFLATSAATDAKNLRRIRKSLKTQESLIV